MHQTMCREEKNIRRHSKVAKYCLITFYKKYRSSHRRCRSSHRSCSVKKGLLRNFANFTGKHNQVADLQSASFLQKRFQHKCFPVKFAKLLRTPILKNICKRLLLEVFYKKAVLKNFAIFTGRKQLVISFLRERCSWWFIQL